LINDKKKIVTLECRLSSDLLGHKLNNSEMLGIVLMSLNSSLSLREEVGFNYYSEMINTHNLGIGDTLTC